MVGRVLGLTLLMNCLPVEHFIVLPDRTELVKHAKAIELPEPEKCTRDYMAEYMIIYDDDLAAKSGCYGALNAAVYCLQLHPCVDERSLCTYEIERFDKCVTAGFEKRYKKLSL